MMSLFFLVVIQTWHMCFVVIVVFVVVVYLKVKWSRYRPGVAQKVGRGIALLFHDRGTGRGWVVSSMPRPHFSPGKDPVPILQECVYEYIALSQTIIKWQKQLVNYDVF